MKVLTMLFAALFALFLLPVASPAQHIAGNTSASTPAGPPATEAAPVKAPANVADAFSAPVDKLQAQLELKELQLTATKRALVEANYRNLVAEVSKIQDEFAKQSAELQRRVAALYAKLQLKREEYDINFETGAITPISKEAGNGEQKQ